MAIIVLDWNGWRNTIECMESLRRITYLNCKIIVVDNGSTDDSIKELKYWTANHGGDFANAPLETLATVRSDVSLEIVFSLAGRVFD